jgi:hypothetical protein
MIFMGGYTPAETVRVYRFAAAVTVFVAWCLLLAVSSTPRRVGDGVEYWAMAEQMRTGRPPSATRGELARLEREAQGIGRGFDQSPVRFPGLVSADGRQDFPHFWLYPLLNVPAYAVVAAMGLHPNWAFTLTNILLLAAAFAVVARRASIGWAILLLAGPIVWWIDKAHGDVFTVSLLAIACALWQTAPSRTVVVVAIAAAQNPALVPVSAVVSLTALTRGDEPVRRRIMAVAVGAAIVAVPLAYYRSRLGVWSPLIGYTHPAWPSLRAMVSLLVDPNIGLLPNVPFLAIAGLWVWMAPAQAQAKRAEARETGPWRNWLLAGIACGLMLAAYAQSVNLNHGATPGLNRWTLWLTPWLLLIARGSPPAPARVERSERRARVLLLLALLNAAWAGWFFRPSVPEGYRYPTAAASWLWTHVPRWYQPAPEIFAERVSHREPALLPVAWPGCTVVLIVDGRWPASCPPTMPAPDVCRGVNRLCYYTPPGTFTPLGDAAFPWLPASAFAIWSPSTR